MRQVLNPSFVVMKNQPLLPIIQADDVESGVNAAKAMENAGVNLVEVVIRTDASLDIITAIKQQLPDLQVAAGTVIDAKVLSAALSAGSDMIVTPGISMNLLNHLKDCPVPVLPGVANVADILMAREHGYTELKLFPANIAGGVGFLSSIASVFKDISFCPTGGVSESNRMDYLSLPNVFAVGGSWVAPKQWIEQKEWQKITDACVSALS